MIYWYLSPLWYIVVCREFLRKLPSSASTPVLLPAASRLYAGRAHLSKGTIFCWCRQRWSAVQDCQGAGIGIVWDSALDVLWVSKTKVKDKVFSGNSFSTYRLCSPVSESPPTYRYRNRMISVVESPSCYIALLFYLSYDVTSTTSLAESSAS